MKNNIFDFKRFTKLAQLNIKLNQRKILIALGAFVGILILIASMMASFGRSFDSLQITMASFSSVCLIVGLATVASKAFDNVNTSPKAISYLTIPSSTTEKFIWAWGSSLILYAIIFFITFLVGSNISNALFAAITHEPFQLFSIDKLPNGMNDIVNESIFSFISTHAVFFLGAIYFKKASIGKTILSSIATYTYFIVLGLICAGVVSGIFDSNQTSFHFEMSDILESAKLPNIKYLPYVIPAVLYSAAFFRFKEKEA